jgi:hypothetical protein
MGYTEGALPGQTSSGGRDAYIRKYDGDGNEIWTRQFGTSAFDDVRDVAVDSSDNVYVAGLTLGTLPGQENLGNYDAFVRKYDGAGNEIWTRQFGTSDNDRAGDVAVDGSNNAYLLGITSGTFPGQTSSGGWDAFVREYDSAGNEIWTRQCGSSADEYVSSVTVDSSGKVYISGDTYGTLPGQTSSGDVDAFLVKFAVFTGGIEVTIENKFLEGLPCETLAFTIDVHNSSNIVDNISLSYIPDGWPDITIDENLLLDVLPSEHRQATMFVHVPDGALPCTYKEITVVAESQFCGATDNDTAMVHVISQLESFTLQLLAGWNLVCFPVDNGPTTPDGIFTGLTYYTDYYIYSWTAPSGPYSLIGPTDTLQDNLGYWVYINTDYTLAYSGIRPSSRDVYIVTGWNMVGFPIENASTTPQNIFAPLVYYTDYYMYTWTAPSGPYALVGPTDQLLDNTGYWVYTTTDTMVTVP